jgi:phage major head subunit gpT-like protein
MPTPMQEQQFGDLLDPRFQRIFHEEKDAVPSMIGDIYTTVPHNGRQNMTWSEVGTLPDWSEFTGTVPFNSLNQGYDVTMTFVEFANGIQVERKLFDDDQYQIMEQRPKSLGAAYSRTREKHAFRLFNNAFSVDSFFYAHSEGVALCSNSHTTTSGASTATGFDNLTTSSLTAVAVAAARIQMIDFRGDQAEKIDVTPDELWYPPNLYEQAYEIMKASGKVDTSNNNPNVHQGQYKGYECRYFTDTNNWFMCDGRMRRMYVFWSDRVPVEFAMVEDFDTLVAKWRGYARYANVYTNWRWALGAQVA